VLGALDELPQWAERLNVAQAIIAMPSGSHLVRRRAIEVLQPGRGQGTDGTAFDDLLSGRVAISQIARRGVGRSAGARSGNGWTPPGCMSCLPARPYW